MSSSDAPPRTVGPYRLVRFIASGGVAEVWEAQGPQSPPNVALKVIYLHDAGEDMARRFIEEARIGASLSHPNIVKVDDLGREGDTFYFSMQLLEGQPLSRMVQAPAPVGAVLAIAEQALEALQYAHAHADSRGYASPIVHRDIKPSNLFLVREGVLKVIDFGVARVMTEARSKTSTQNFIGTVAYASPEQLRRKAVDGRSDLFSLALVLHELLTGRRVFDGSEGQVVSDILFSPVPPVRQSRPEMPAGFDAWISSCLEKEVDKRPKNSREALVALRKATQDIRPFGAVQLSTWITAVPELQTTEGRGPSLGSDEVRPTAIEELRPGGEPGRRPWGWFAGAAGLTLGIFMAVNAGGPKPLATLAVAPVMNAVEVLPAREPTPLPGPLPTATVLDAGHPEPVGKPVRETREPAGIGFITVDAKPGWGQVRIDGKDIGPTPLFRHELPSGRHRVEVQRPDGKLKSCPQVAVSPGREARCMVTW